MMTFTDDTITKIADNIGSEKPETGGALFGPNHSNVVSFFEFDKEARTTASTYTPSKKLLKTIPEIEETEGLIFKGIIHSHPGSFDCPSGPDLDAFRRTLKDNSHITTLYTPIVNFDAADDAVPLNDASGMQVYEVFRSNNPVKPVDIEKVSVRVIPIDTVTQHVINALKDRGLKKLLQLRSHRSINGTTFLHRNISWSSPKRKKKDHLDLYFASDFPTVSPIVSLTINQEQNWLPVTWSLQDFAIDALAKRLIPILEASNPIFSPTQKKENKNG